MSEAYPLPAAFRQQMLHQLGSEAEAYFAALEQPYLRGLRLNPRKPLASPEELIDGLLAPVCWNASTGRYLATDSGAGLSPLHEGGGYYIQEPSAMAPVSLLAPVPGERVLDLCAAPGGKSTQIADALMGQGLLVCNEPVPSRAKILSRNIERMGVTNAVVVCAEPEQLAPKWPELFDAILVDAPCSGEGMFRRHPETRAEWNEQSPAGCAARQKRILTSAWQMLRPGGRLCYSTCTFNETENEGVIRWLLDTFPDAAPSPFVLPVDANKTLSAPEGMLHLYPHQLQGEGHFVALLHKAGNAPAAALMPPDAALAPVKKEQQAAYAAFQKGLGCTLPGGNALFGDVLLSCPDLPPLKGIKTLRAGLQLGAMKGKLFFPDHALAMALEQNMDFPIWEADKNAAAQYLRGETLACPDETTGFIAVAYKGIVLGFGKASGGQIKNHYPKGLRRP